jgi:hypothetical protein
MTRRHGQTPRFSKPGGLHAAIPILIVAAVACGRVSETDQRRTAGVTFPFAERIGWLHGSCFAIQNPDLALGTTLALVITAEPQRVQQARIGERTNVSAKCQALIEGRAAINSKPGLFFYVLESTSIGSTDMGLGIVAPPANPEVVSGLARVDLDRDGHDEVFSSCATAEGVKFAIWTGKAYQGEPRWTGYYYLDYETTPNCP